MVDKFLVVFQAFYYFFKIIKINIDKKRLKKNKNVKMTSKNERKNSLNFLTNI